MTQTLDFQDVITKGIQGLPTKYLSEVADFVVFMRCKAFEGDDPCNFENIKHELSLMDARQLSHLEDEFKDFDQLFPKE